MRRKKTKDEVLKKLDALSQQELARHPAGAPVDLLLRLEDAPTAAQSRALEKTGCAVRSAIGNIVTASIAPARLRELAKLPFVKSIELPRVLFSERR